MDQRPIIEHYAGGVEFERLLEGSSRIEFERTKELLLRHLPDPPASILDVGGGPGRYAIWLAQLGYDVHLVDLSPLHVEQARAAAAALDRPFRVSLGDARALQARESSHDVVLLLGPLYHLTERVDRLAALGEAVRVVHPGGVVAAAAVSRFASLLDGLRERALGNPVFDAIVERDLADGQHRNPSDRPEWFTTAFFHLPHELRSEILDAGLHLDSMVGVEGPGWLLYERFDDVDDRERILRVARAVEHEPSLLGVSSHLLAFARRPA